MINQNTHKLTQRYKIISFDLDNALYDNQPVLERAEKLSENYLAEEFSKQNQFFDYQKFLQIKQSLLQKNDPQFENLSLLRQTALNQFCARLKNADKIAVRAFDIFLLARSEVTILPEIVNLLKTLSSHYTLVSVSNGNCDPNQTVLGSFFCKNYSPSIGGRAKPHPQMLLQVIQDFELSPAQLIHVGDSLEKDGGSARAAGVGFYAFAPFKPPFELQKACDQLLAFLSV